MADVLEPHCYRLTVSDSVIANYGNSKHLLYWTAHTVLYRRTGIPFLPSCGTTSAFAAAFAAASASWDMSLTSSEMRSKCVVGRGQSELVSDSANGAP